MREILWYLSRGTSEQSTPQSPTSPTPRQVTVACRHATPSCCISRWGALPRHPSKREPCPSHHITRGHTQISTGNRCIPPHASRLLYVQDGVTPRLFSVNWTRPSFPFQLQEGTKPHPPPRRPSPRLPSRSRKAPLRRLLSRPERGPSPRFPLAWEGGSKPTTPLQLHEGQAHAFI